MQECTVNCSIGDIRTKRAVTKTDLANFHPFSHRPRETHNCSEQGFPIPSAAFKTNVYPFHRDGFMPTRGLTLPAMRATTSTLMGSSNVLR